MTRAVEVVKASQRHFALKDILVSKEITLANSGSRVGLSQLFNFYENRW